MRFVWVDVEEQAEVVDGIDVDNFPTVLIASGEGLLFFGPLTPQPDILVRLIRAHAVDNPRTLLQDPNLSVLLAHLRVLASE